MILMLFGAIAMAGVIGTGYMATMKGPGRALSENSRANSIENNMIAATKLVISGDAAQQDCDGDGTVEPMAFRTGAGPTGGGLIPLTSGASKNDPWGKALGYCVWDHGKKTVSDNVAECGGSAANRLSGGNVTTENVLAIVSAGKDGIFQTTCNAWADVNADKIADTPLIVTAPGSDDIVRKDTIESLLASGSLTQLPSLPDSACVVGAEGTMRYENGVMQVCATTAPNGWNGDPGTLPPPTWKEVGATSGQMAGNFTPVGPVNPNTTQTSNQITVGGFFGSKDVTVDGGAVILVNGVDRGPNTTVIAGDQVAIRGPSANFLMPATSLATTPKIFTLQIGAVNKQWTVTTRSRTPAALAISPTPSTGMNVVGPDGVVGWSTGSSVQFTVTNTGEATTASVMNLPALVSGTNFTVTGTNTCTTSSTHPVPPNTFSLAGGATCTFWVQPRANGVGAISTNMSISAGALTSNTVALSGNATGWGCNLPWGGTIAHAANVNAYSTAGPHGCCTGAGIIETRTCTNAVLSGSFTIQTCSLTPCAGYRYQCYCWYRSAKGGSCTSICSSRGGTTAGTVNVSGNAGTMAHCSHLLTYYGLMGDGTTRNGGGGNLGCVYYDGFIFGNNQRRWWETGATSQGASSGDRYRTCSCAN